MLIIQWGEYCFDNLPTGVSNSPDIFQQNMNNLFQAFEFIGANINYLLIIKRLLELSHIILGPTLTKLKECGLTKKNGTRTY